MNKAQSKKLQLKKVQSMSSIRSHALLRPLSNLECLGRVSTLIGVVVSTGTLGCSEAVVEPTSEPAAPHAAAPLVGDAGGLVVDSDTVLNAYAALVTDADATDTTLEVDDVANLALDGDELDAGDLLLVIQMQGAAISEANSATYGEVTELGGAGLFEFVTVGAVEENVISLDAESCGALRSSYSVDGRTQVVRVPQLTSLTVNDGASVRAEPWDGIKGGLVVVQVAGQTVLNGTGSIDVSGMGFRGGIVDDASQSDATDVPDYRSTDEADGGDKGEGIAGFGDDYTMGRYGRGAPANGGGGGNSHNAGGGGGANARLAGAEWTGLGVMDPAFTEVWGLEPTATTLSASPGGGRGGYTYSNSNEDATTVPPGDDDWGGNRRQVLGGLGGRPLDPDPMSRVFAGGGGGAGDANNGVGGPGGAGGGIAILLSDSLSGTGSVLADGSAGGNAQGALNDAPGGGGGGGTIIVQATLLSGVGLRARGGEGGNQIFPDESSDETEGPGGGGGGGFIALSTAFETADASGGSYGTTNSPALTEFAANGATSGGVGNVLSAFGSLPFCSELGLTATLSDGLTEVASGASTTYAFTIASNGLATQTDVSVELPSMPELIGLSWTCTPALACGATSGTDAAVTLSQLAPGDVVTYPVTATVNAEVDTTLTAEATVTAGTAEVTAADTTDVVAPPALTLSAPTTVTTPEDAAYVFGEDAPVTLGVPGAAGQTVTVTITAENGTLTLAEVTSLTFVEGDGSGDASITFTATPTDAAAALVGLTFTPSPDFNGDALVRIDVTAEEVTEPASATVEVTVTPVNDPPVSAEDSVVASSGESVTIPVLDNDEDVDGDALSVAEVGTPASGTVVINADGTLTYTPDAGGSGVVEFPYTVSDGQGGTDEGSVVVDLGGEDSDEDGASDDFEVATGTDPQDGDSDDDGLLDGDEPNPGADTDGDGLINALDPDADDDGLLDGTEAGRDCADPATDSARGSCVADLDPTTTTDPLDTDTDGGGASDGSEDSDLNGRVDDGETAPTTGNDGDDEGLVDSDADGLSDTVELTLGSDPNDADTDDDGTSDGDERNPSLDMDGDDSLDVNDPDSDGDGLWDGTEDGRGCELEATDTRVGQCVADGDSGATVTSPVDPDTDDGGVEDGAEDWDSDGVEDDVERDPTSGHGDDDPCALDSACGAVDSGLICDGGACTEGCRGSDGNGCPVGEACSSSGATPGVCEDVVPQGTAGGAGASGGGGTAGAPLAEGGSGNEAGTATTGGSPTAGTAGTAGGSGGAAAGAGGAAAAAGAGEAGTRAEAGTRSEAGATSDNNAAGAPASARGGDSLEGGGCGCRVDGHGTQGRYALLSLGLLGLVGLARRRGNPTR